MTQAERITKAIENIITSVYVKRYSQTKTTKKLLAELRTMGLDAYVPEQSRWILRDGEKADGYVRAIINAAKEAPRKVSESGWTRYGDGYSTEVELSGSELWQALNTPDGLPDNERDYWSEYDNNNYPAEPCVGAIVQYRVGLRSNGVSFPRWKEGHVMAPETEMFPDPDDCIKIEHWNGTVSRYSRASEGYWWRRGTGTQDIGRDDFAEPMTTHIATYRSR